MVFSAEDRVLIKVLR